MMVLNGFTYSNRSALVDTAFICFVRGRDADYVATLVDSGALTWVWDIAANQKTRSCGSRIRELRFWANEVLTPQMTARLTLDEVISKLLPSNRHRFSTAEVRQMLLVSRPKAVNLCRRMGAAKSNTTFQVERQQFANYLREAWVGGGGKNQA